MTTDIFSTKIKNIRLINSIIRCMSFNEDAVVHLSNDGIRVITEDVGVMQTLALFCYDKTDISLKLNLCNIPSKKITSFTVGTKILVEVLNTFLDSNNGISMSFDEHNLKLTVNVDHDFEHFATECSIKTQPAIETMKLQISEGNIMSKIELNGPSLYTLLNDFNKIQINDKIELNHSSSCFEVSAYGTTDLKVSLRVEKDSDMVVNFHADNSFSFEYKWSYVKSLLKVLCIATMVAISTTKEGILNLRCLIEDDSECKVFVDFSMFPLN